MIGILKVKINGLNSDKIINRLIDSGVILRDLKQKRKGVEFIISESDERELKTICKRFHKKYEIISRSNFINFIKHLKFYFGTFLAFCLIFVFVFSFNSYIYKINVQISSDLDFKVEDINELLVKNNITIGTRKKNINEKELQNLILSSLENVAGCTVKKNGNVLDVIIYPAVMKEENNINDMVSNFDAVITDVKVFSGEANVKAGDIVRKGDILIKNKDGACGEVFGKVYFTDYIIYNEIQIVKEFSGNFIESKRISIFNKILGKQVKNVGFSKYLEENCVFSVSKNMFFPISIVKTKYREFEYMEKVVKFESVEEELKQNLYNEVLKKVQNKDKITNVTYSVVTENNLTRLDCFIECELNLLEKTG